MLKASDILGYPLNLSEFPSQKDSHIQDYYLSNSQYLIWQTKLFKSIEVKKYVKQLVEKVHTSNSKNLEFTFGYGNDSPCYKILIELVPESFFIYNPQDIGVSSKDLELRLRAEISFQLPALIFLSEFKATITKYKVSIFSEFSEYPMIYKTLKVNEIDNQNLFEWNYSE